jgi:hypothetical protein
MKKFEISEELANALLNYLADRPLREVAVLFNALQGAVNPQVREVKPEATEQSA